MNSMMTLCSPDADCSRHFAKEPMEVDNEAYELRLKATMNGLSLDLDRLYTLSFKRFSR